MSLDVYLTKTEKKEDVEPKIFVRREGSIEEISREQWDILYPGQEPIVTKINETTAMQQCYWANITHNLGSMAEAAGLYYPLWRPEEINISKAMQLIEPLTVGLNNLQSDPDKFKVFNPSNGWGNYDGLIRFVENYLAACKENPDADVSVSR